MRTAFHLFVMLLIAWAGPLPRVVSADNVIHVDPNSFAAIAYSPSTGEFRFAYGHTSREGAQEAALRKCTAKDARIVCWVNHGFCALALGDDKRCWGTGWRFGDGASSKDTVNAALENCRDRTTGVQLGLCLTSDGQYLYEPPPAKDEK